MSKSPPTTADPSELSSPKKFTEDDDRHTIPKYKLTYTNYRWGAEPARLILSYVGEDFEDVRVDWDQFKKESGYGKLPLLEFEGKKLRQCFAIARFLGNRYNLAGANEFEAAKCDEYAEAMKDIIKESEGMWTEDESQKLKTQTTLRDKWASPYFSQMERDLKENGGQFLVGNNFTWVDFLVAHFNEVMESMVDQTLLENYPTLKAHQQNVFSQPKIKAWLAKRPVTEI